MHCKLGNAGACVDRIFVSMPPAGTTLSYALVKKPCGVGSDIAASIVSPAVKAMSLVHFLEFAVTANAKLRRIRSMVTCTCLIKASCDKLWAV